jgi:hypothetical protein
MTGANSERLAALEDADQHLLGVGEEIGDL